MRFYLVSKQEKCYSWSITSKGNPSKLLLSIFSAYQYDIFGKTLTQGVIYKEIVLDKEGSATLQMPVLTFLSGSFQFPASQIQTSDMVAHSGVGSFSPNFNVRRRLK